MAQVNGRLIGLNHLAGLAAAVKAPLAERDRWLISVVFLVVGFMLGNKPQFAWRSIGAFTGGLSSGFTKGATEQNYFLIDAISVLWHYSFRVICVGRYLFSDFTHHCCDAIIFKWDFSIHRKNLR